MRWRPMDRARRWCSRLGLVGLVVCVGALGPSAAPVLGQAQWSVATPPTLVVGEVTPDFNGFFQITGASLLSDGRLAVADQAPQVSIFSPEGEFQMALGGAGQGPGEFSLIGWMSVLPGDTILAWDWNNFRISTWLSDGTLLADVGLRGTPPRFIVGKLADGSFLSRLRADDDPQARGLYEVNFEMAKVNEAGVLDALLPKVWGREVYDGGERTRRLMGSGELLKATRVVPAGDRYYVATGREFVVDAYSLDGQLMHRLVRDAPIVRTTRTDILELYPERFSSFLVDDFPDDHTLPVTGEVVVDWDEFVWVEHYQRKRFENDPETPGIWSVFDRGGALVAEAQTPPRFRPFDIGTDYMVGVVLGDFDVEYVQVLELRR